MSDSSTPRWTAIGLVIVLLGVTALPVADAVHSADYWEKRARALTRCTEKLADEIGGWLNEQKCKAHRFAVSISLRPDGSEVPPHAEDHNSGGGAWFVANLPAETGYWDLGSHERTVRLGPLEPTHVTLELARERNRPVEFTIRNRDLPHWHDGTGDGFTVDKEAHQLDCVWGRDAVRPTCDDDHFHTDLPGDDPDDDWYDPVVVELRVQEDQFRTLTYRLYWDDRTAPPPAIDVEDDDSSEARWVAASAYNGARCAESLVPCTAASGTGNAEGQVATSGTGKAEGWVAASGLGAAKGDFAALAGWGSSRCTSNLCVAASGLGDAGDDNADGPGENEKALVAATGYGHAEGETAASGDSANGDFLAVGGVGDARCEWDTACVAVSGTEEAHGTNSASPCNGVRAAGHKIYNPKEDDLETCV